MNSCITACRVYSHPVNAIIIVIFMHIYLPILKILEFIVDLLYVKVSPLNIIVAIHTVNDGVVEAIQLGQ